MSKTFSSVCAEIAVLLTIFGSIHCTSVTSKTTASTEGELIDNVDVSNKNATNQSIEDYKYYRSLVYVSKEETSQIWSQQRYMPELHSLSSLHRKADNIKLRFEFPFYGHHVSNVTVTTGGFIFTGERIHSYLATTQYIAPLMANFDLSLSNESFVRVQDNGTAFTVVWESVIPKYDPNHGKFTFSTTLHQSGDIVFVYYQLPTLIENIQHDHHPLKVGLADAYTVEEVTFLARRMTISEYHRVALDKHNIKNSTIIRLTALPTCLRYKDCQSCNNHKTKFDCVWCPVVNRCSTHNGIDRLHQNWESNVCWRSLISTRDRCPTLPTTTATTEGVLIDNVDVSNKNQSIEDYDYYRSLVYVSKEETSQIWSQLRQIPEHHNLSSAHLKAVTVKLKFDFPFYGHHVRNVTVATGGFIYTGEYIHSWLSATQYIAPLMANFNLSLSNESFVRVQDNGTAFTVFWESVILNDDPNHGKFTFSTTLHQTGDIVFVYYQLPTLIENIQGSQHPVKVGLADAYTVEKVTLFARRKTVHEYHRVALDKHNIKNSTIIRLTALPTCLRYKDCQSCNNHKTKFDCAWCPAVNRCSTHNGIDRLYQNWEMNECEDSLISTRDRCPTLPPLATS